MKFKNLDLNKCLVILATTLLIISCSKKDELVGSWKLINFYEEGSGEPPENHVVQVFELVIYETNETQIKYPDTTLPKEKFRQEIINGKKAIVSVYPDPDPNIVDTIFYKVNADTLYWSYPVFYKNKHLTDVFVFERIKKGSH